MVESLILKAGELESNYIEVLPYIPHNGIRLFSLTDRPVPYMAIHVMFTREDGTFSRFPGNCTTSPIFEDNTSFILTTSKWIGFRIVIPGAYPVLDYDVIVGYEFFQRQNLEQYGENAGGPP